MLIMLPKLSEAADLELMFIQDEGEVQLEELSEEEDDKKECSLVR